MKSIRPHNLLEVKLRFNRELGLKYLGRHNNRKPFKNIEKMESFVKLQHWEFFVAENVDAFLQNSSQE